MTTKVYNSSERAVNTRPAFQACMLPPIEQALPDITCPIALTSFLITVRLSMTPNKVKPQQSVRRIYRCPSAYTHMCVSGNLQPETIGHYLLEPAKHVDVCKTCQLSNALPLDMSPEPPWALRERTSLGT